MKMGVLFFWSVLAVSAIVRIAYSFSVHAPDIGHCLSKKVRGTGIVIREPERKESGQVMVVAVHELYLNTSVLSEHSHASTSSPVCATDLTLRMKTKLHPRFVYGDHVMFTGTISQPFDFQSDTGRVFDYSGYLAKDDIFYEIKSAHVYQDTNEETRGGRTVSRVLFYIKRKFVSNLEYVLGEPHAALAAGLVVGEKSALGADLLENFRIVGLIHIVVLSGFNITIVGDALRRALSFLPRVWGICIGGTGIILFGIMVGGGATVVRSCFMASVALNADLMRRDYQVIRALMFAGLIMIILDPVILFNDPSFQLSFLATLGLILLASPLEKKLSIIPERFGMRGIVASTFATQLFVSPYILYMMGTMSLIGVIVNILVLPIIPVTMLVVFIAGVIGFVSTPLAHICGWVAHFLLSYELATVDFFARIPYASIEVPLFSYWWVVCFYCVFCAVFSWYTYRKNRLTNTNS